MSFTESMGGKSKIKITPGPFLTMRKSVECRPEGDELAEEEVTFEQIYILILQST